MGATLLGGVQKKDELQAVSVIAQQVAKFGGINTAKSIGTTAVSSALGITAASTVTGSTTAGIVAVVGAGSVAPLALAVGVGLGVGYGAKKLFDWIVD